MRKQISLRLSELVVEKLERFAGETGLSKAKIIERMVRRAPFEMVSGHPGKDVEPDVPLPVPTVEDLVPAAVQASFDASKSVREISSPVQDISATKKVRPAVGPQQGRTTLTGRPFGPVPKS